MPSSTSEKRGAPDSLLADFALPLDSEFFPLGHSLHLSTNSTAVLEAAELSWQGSPRLFDEPTIRLTIGVTDDRPESKGSPPVFRSRGHLLSIISDARNFLVCDMRAGFGYGWFSREIVEDAGYFRYYFLEAAALLMIDQLYLAAVHGAVVARDNAGILLCGDSGAGKSTLAYACAREGWAYISDDGAYLVRSCPDLFALGNCRVMRFRSDAARLFPELSGQNSGVRPNGKIGFELFTGERQPVIDARPGALLKHVVFLHRRPGTAPALKRRLDKDALDFSRVASYGEESVRMEQALTYDRLTDLEWWDLDYAGFEEAVGLLEGLTELGGSKK